MKVSSYSSLPLPSMRDFVTITFDELEIKVPVSELHINPDFVDIARKYNLSSYLLRRAGTKLLSETPYTGLTQSLYVDEKGKDGTLVFHIDPPRRAVMVNKSKQEHLKAADEVFLLVTGVSLGNLCKDYDKQV